MAYKRRDCIEEATALFSRFVSRHGLAYEVERDAPIEVLCTVPVQPGLSLPLVLGLQNFDELNFGVEDFWSYFFPFDDVAEQFERTLDMWVRGQARILAMGWRGRVLQVSDGSEWRTVYSANRIFARKIKAIIQNDPNYSNSTIT